MSNKEVSSQVQENVSKFPKKGEKGYLTPSDDPTVVAIGFEREGNGRPYFAMSIDMKKLATAEIGSQVSLRIVDLPKGRMAIAKTWKPSRTTSGIIQ